MSRRKKHSAPMSLFSFQDIITATTGILILLALILALSVIIQGAESTVDLVLADDELLAYRTELFADVEQMKQLTREIAVESSTWSSATPADLARKIEIASAKRDRLLDSIQTTEESLDHQQEQFQKLNSIAMIQDLDAKLLNATTSVEDLTRQIKELKSNNRLVYNFRNSSRAAWLVEISGTRILAAKVSTKDSPKSFRSAYEFNRFTAGLQSSEQYFVLVVKPSGIANYRTIKPYLMQEQADIGTELVSEDQVVVDPVKGAGF